MRNPRRQRNIAVTLLAISLAVIVLAFTMPYGLGLTLQSILAGSGLTIGSFAAVWAVLRTRDSYLYTRLKNGEGVIARWIVLPAEWSEFRVMEEREHISNELDLTRDPPALGVEVLVSDDAVCVGDDFFAFRSNVDVTLHDTWIQFDQVLSNAEGFDGHEVMRIPLIAGLCLALAGG